MHQTLKIHEIFTSIQGEGPFSGLPTTFIRLTGCPLRCQYCDTAYAFKGGENMSIDAILSKLKASHTTYVCITGGEPLAQNLVHQLITSLCDLAYDVSIETSGSLSIAKVDERATCIMDLKTPGSNEESKNDLNNLDILRSHDHIKFVICDENDFLWSKKMASSLNLKHNQIWFSPEHTSLSATTLADWMIDAKIPYRLQIQLHKYLWGDIAGK
ncbi:MAG: radical SAM protein [Pseudomonadota bacterium]|nr:radical SAM protein [Pseudomonadota bacterium]